MSTFFRKQSALVVLLTVIAAGSIFVVLREIEVPFAALLKNGAYFFNFVTKENSLGRYIPANLQDLSAVGAPDEYIRKVAYQELISLMEAAKKDGAPLTVISAYRSFDRQKFLHSYYTRKYGANYADRISAEAGYSEHQLGTTVDFGTGNPAVDLKQAFADTTQGKWLRQNAWRHGFVLIYPKNAENITGYAYEPWQYRFIGKEAAKKVHRAGISLYEYLQTKEQAYVASSLSNVPIQPPETYNIYRVAENGLRHKLANEAAFLSYGYNWNDVRKVDRATFEEIERARLFRRMGYDKVYFLDNNNILHWIPTPKKLKSAGYNWEDVVDITDRDFLNYSKGAPIQ